MRGVGLWMTPSTLFTESRLFQMERAVAPGTTSVSVDIGMIQSSILPHRTYCTVIGGVQGCCKVDHVCNQLANECTIEGQQRCPGENFCCGEHSLKSPLRLHPSPLTSNQIQAAGDRCFRDADGHPKCSSTNISVPSSSSSIPPTPTSRSSLSSKPTQSGTVPTPVSTTSSRPTMCRLKSDQSSSRGFLSRRRQTPVHPSQHRRRNWFRRPTGA